MSFFFVYIANISYLSEKKYLKTNKNPMIISIDKGFLKKNITYKYCADRSHTIGLVLSYERENRANKTEAREIIRTT